MNNYLKKLRLALYILIIPYIVLILFLTVPTKYVLYVPGNVSDINDVICLNDCTDSSTYYATSVSYISDITLFQKFVYGKSNEAMLYKKTVSDKIDSEMSEIEHNSAIYSSIICAYNCANIDLEYEYKGTYVYYTKSKVLKIGDVILGKNYKESVSNSKLEEIPVLRDGVIMNLKADEIDSLVLEYPYYEIKNSNVTLKTVNGGGPSAGFMQSLKLYDDLLTKVDLVKNRKIAGTGTIDTLGNVGAIGCIGLKIYAAYYNNCDIFFAPVENEKEALDVYNKLDTKMKLVFVSNIDEAINYLEA